jgi:ATP-dependent RNA helicase DDX19/DBP5
MKKESLRLKGVKNYTVQLASDDAKLQFIEQVHLRLERSMTMVFVNKKDTASKLQARLAKRGVKATILVGGLQAADRDNIIDGFRKLEFTTLIATNVLARGIDVPEVDLVISFDVPMRQIYGWKEPDYANFMHRTGRTGRYGTDGLSVTLMQEETDSSLMEDIAKYYQMDIPAVKSFEELEEIFKVMRPGAKEDV